MPHLGTYAGEPKERAKTASRRKHLRTREKQMAQRKKGDPSVYVAFENLADKSMITEGEFRTLRKSGGLIRRPRKLKK